MARTTPVPLEQVLGQQVRVLRERLGLRQEQVAEAARRAGLAWQRGTIAMIEGGRRQLSFGEVLMLPSVFMTAAPDSRLTVRDLLPDDDHEPVQVAGDAVQRVGDLRRQFVQMALDVVTPRSLDAAATSDRPVSLGAAWSYRPAMPEPPELRALPLRWRRAVLRAIRGQVRPAGDGRGGTPPGLWLMARIEVAEDAVQKAALALRVPPLALVLASHATWGHGLTTEREQRLKARLPGELSDVPARRLQAMRGQVTRQLLGALRPGLAAITNQAKPSKRSPRR